MEEVEVGKNGRKSRSKMLSKVAWKICVLCCVFFKTEKRDIYIGAEIVLKYAWKSDVARRSLFVSPWRPHGDTLLCILRSNCRHENHLVRHFANGDPEGNLTLSPLAIECRHGDQVATYAYLETFPPVAMATK